MKSGSTWITQIVAAHGKWTPIPKDYRNEKWFNPSLPDGKFSEFFNAQEFVLNQWFCKQHWHHDEKFINLLYDNSVRIVNIVRDLRDVLVSRYFHDSRLGNTSVDNVPEYYFEDHGRARLRGYIEYHWFWHNSRREKQPYLCVFENLIADFGSEVHGLFEFLDQPLSQEEISRIQDKTSFKNKRVTGEGNFFRKGVVGD
jgi:hypothetical protein